MNKLEEVRNNCSIKSDSKVKQILVCTDTGCSSSSSLNILEKLKELVIVKNIDIEVIKIGCLGLCAKGPFVIIKPDDVCYGNVSLSDCEDIIESHILKNQLVDRILIKDENNEIVKSLKDLPFYNKQNRRVLKLCGVINPENINDYILNDGYKALEKSLTLSSEEIIKEVTDSNLRGRGGAGFSTGFKWNAAYLNENDQKYVVCNADEGDPGAFMDRSILESCPHLVIEAMIISAFTIKASKGYIYIRAEYPNAVKRLKLAISQAYEYNLLGKNILGSNFNFDLELRIGAGAFVCGEETALLESIEGKRGMPRGKNPYPTEKGLWGCPTVINNVETFANIPGIILNGSSWFKELGTKKTGGTKVFALGGNIVNTGLAEIPVGLTLRELVFDIGGGIPDGKKFKAAQTGGPSGGCIPESLLDVKMDYEDLKEAGSMMGSGGLIVMDEDKCMVSLAKFYLDFSLNESCGKCTPCRVGVERMYEILDRICKGQGKDGDLEKLENLANIITRTSLCGLGQTAPNPVLSTLKYFKDEYIEHIKDKKCSANECDMDSNVKIIADKCVGCGLCQKNCPVEAIEGEAKEKRTINEDKCINCEKCIASCPFNAIER